ncbi:MAG: MarR family transcriptional regulator [Alphaproteobacteria bacterium]|nr:MarR family transcriptional regulator [Alphaproteobacteria bacterium]
MASNNNGSEHLIRVLQETMVALVRRDVDDLSSRQLGVMLISYLSDGPHTVRGLAAKLNVSKPAITRALDRLADHELTRRKHDPSDRRSVLVQRTPKGNAFMRELRNTILAAEQRVNEAAKAEAGRK